MTELSNNQKKSFYTFLRFECLIKQKKESRNLLLLWSSFDNVDWTQLLITFIFIPLFLVLY